MNLRHVRKPMPRRGGNSFYRDTRDLTKFAATVCGAAITDKDLPFRDATTKVTAKWFAKQTDIALCPACLSACQQQKEAR